MDETEARSRDRPIEGEGFSHMSFSPVDSSKKTNGTTRLRRVKSDFTRQRRVNPPPLVPLVLTCAIIFTSIQRPRCFP